MNPLDYWEFHLKIDADDSATHGAHISFNAFKSEVVPLVTLRLYQVSYNEAMHRKGELIEAIQAAGFPTHREIHQELSIYDTNIDLDKGWLPGPSE